MLIDQLFSQALECIHTTYKEQLDASYVVLRLQSNYKGNSIRETLVPHKTAFAAQPQIPTIPINLKPKTRRSLAPGSTILNTMPTIAEPPPPSPTTVEPRSNVAKRQSMESIDEPPVSPRKTVDSASVSPAVSSRGNIVVADKIRSSYELHMNTSMSEPLQQLLHADALSAYSLKPSSHREKEREVLRVMALPRDEQQRLLLQRNFNRIFDCLSVYELPLSSILISPSPGFVILAQRVKPLRKVYINVCHHPYVGLISVQQSKITEMG
jgi:hypothetical protein